jgi:hypothetical protein
VNTLDLQWSWVRAVSAPAFTIPGFLRHYKHTHTHTHTHTQTRTQIHTNTHTHPHTHTYIHTLIHKYTHTRHANQTHRSSTPTLSANWCSHQVGKRCDEVDRDGPAQDAVCDMLGIDSRQNPVVNRQWTAKRQTVRHQTANSRQWISDRATIMSPIEMVR